MTILIGTAGWSLPLAEQVHFPGAGSHLERYAQLFSVVEINSTFSRSHRPSSYVRWHDSVPPQFQFSVKIPKAITHEKRLRSCGSLFRAFIAEVGGLREKLGCLVVQLPPSLPFEAEVAGEFFRMIRAVTEVAVVCEPRNPSWFDEPADKLLRHAQIARVAADPATVPKAAECGGWKGLRYYRLHGSPKPYYSEYSESYLTALARRLAASRKAEPTWCIFDNTTLGAATSNARVLHDFFSGQVERS